MSSGIAGLDDLSDFGEGADGVEAGAEGGGAGTAVEIAEEVRVHLHRGEAIHRRDVVLGELRRQLLAEREDVGEMALAEGQGRFRRVRRCRRVRKFRWLKSLQLTFMVS